MHIVDLLFVWVQLSQINWDQENWMMEMLGWSMSIVPMERIGQ